MINDNTPILTPSPKKNQNQTQQQTNSPPKPQQKLAGRKIPQTMICSYDLITLKQGKKMKMNRIRLQPQPSSPLINPQIQKLKPVFGQCQCTYDQKQPLTQTIFQLSTILVLSKVCHLKLKTITKIKLLQTNNMIKISWKNNQFDQQQNIIIKLKNCQQCYFLFTSIIVRKMLLQDFFLLDMTYNTTYQNFEDSLPKVEGQIYKSSIFFRNWQKLQAKLQQKLTLYNEQKQQIKSIKNISQFWTRFTMYNGYFIVKMFEGLKKIQLGIPLVDFTNLKCQKNWMFLLTRLIK